jgi:glycosyltransferase involved in cell wall biosynthesis
MNKELTIVVPAFNEGEGIKITLQSLIETANKNNWEIIVVNDGSNDKTQTEVEYFKDMVTLINHPYNKGYGAALKTGIRAAKTSYIAMYDADGQHNPGDLEALWYNIGDYDTIIGQRGKGSHQDWMRKPGKWFLGKVANFLAGRKIPDLNSGLRIIKKVIIERMLHLFPDGFSFSTTSTIAFYNMGYSVCNFPIIVNKRIGESSVKQIRHGSQTLLLVLRLIILFNPLKVFIPASILLFIIGLVYEIIYGVIFSSGIKLLPAAFFMLITSVLIFFFGLVVDQISEMRKHMFNN